MEATSPAAKVLDGVSDKMSLCTNASTKRPSSICLTTVDRMATSHSTSKVCLSGDSSWTLRCRKTNTAHVIPYNHVTRADPMCAVQSNSDPQKRRAPVPFAPRAPAAPEEPARSPGPDGARAPPGARRYGRARSSPKALPAVEQLLAAKKVRAAPKATRANTAAVGPPPVHTQRRCVGGRRSSHALASSQFGLASCGCCCCRAQCRGGSGYAPEVPTQCERRRRQREACRMQHATWCAANTATWLSTRFGMRNVGTHRGHILCALKTLTV
jgi:hypothetical protein